MKSSNPTDRRRERGFTLIEILVVLVILSLIASIAIQTALYAFDVARLGSTVGSMRGLTTVIMSYETAHSGVPQSGLVPVTTLEPLLRRMGAPVPLRDGWGNPMFYESLVINGEPSFRVYAYGKDGTPDGAIPGVWIDFFSDIVMESGIFVQTKW